MTRPRGVDGWMGRVSGLSWSMSCALSSFTIRWFSLLLQSMKGNGRQFGMVIISGEKKVNEMWKERVFRGVTNR